MDALACTCTQYYVAHEYAHVCMHVSTSFYIVRCNDGIEMVGTSIQRVKGSVSIRRALVFAKEVDEKTSAFRAHVAKDHVIRIYIDVLIIRACTCPISTEWSTVRVYDAFADCCRRWIEMARPVESKTGVAVCFRYRQFYVSVGLEWHRKYV